ncbi:SRPBCC domain-containing protein [Hyphobacterium sp. HN65]|uniref:SRPBCC domain-containing protein n=1 Tax=Hyphobacterium lacteum TaxID=3116575 RepID=A0ABU7LVJ1_9PROT|nr:SRPBCC domain-containing protein [Hyphobacterium sp. HN65]MEE2527354.1 SRPBCC domain-containing protein [Hyphobacterium sp. HN65]
MPFSERTVFRSFLMLVCLTSVCWLAASNASAQSEVSETGVVETLSEYPIPSQTIVLPVSVTDAWAAFTTSEGYSSWAAPFAVVDLRVNGTIEASYAENAVAGDPANIVISIPAYLPERLLVMKTIQAPPGFATPELLDRLVSIVEFEAVGPSRTRITLSAVGYTDEDEEMRTGFLRANAWVLGQLHAYLTGDTASE